MSGFASLGSFLTPASAGEGKSGGGTGGGLFGAVPSGKGKVSLCFLDVGKLGFSFCGGVSGKDRKKMCVMLPGECSTARHKINTMNHNDFSALTAAGTDHGVFIETLDGKAVYINSHVPLTFLGDPSTYLDVQRSVPQWEQFLAGLKASGEGNLPTEAERSAFFKHVSGEEVVNNGKTPFKKRRVVDSEGSPGTVKFSRSNEDDFMSYVDRDLDPINTIPGLLKAWPVLIDNMNMLQGMLATCYRETLKDFSQETAKDLREVDFSLSTVANVVGPKPVDMAAGTIFELIQSLETRLSEREQSNFTRQHSEDLARVVAILKGIDPKAASLKAVVENLTRDIGLTLQPIMVVISALSSSANTPGDKLSSLTRLLNHWPAHGVGGCSDLLTWVEETEKKVDIILRSPHTNVGSTVGGASSTSGLPMSGLNLGSLGLNPGWNPGGPPHATSTFGSQPGGGLGGAPPNPPQEGNSGGVAPQVSALDIASMQKDISDLKAQAVLSSVAIGGEVFKSLDQVTSWMALHAPGDGAHVGFVDATGLMAICYRDQSTSMDHAKLSSLAREGGFVNIADTKLDFSFSLELPQFWGKDGTQNVHSSDVRVLPNVRDYAEWNGVGGVGGARVALTQWIEHDMDNVCAGINVGGSREARLVSDEMIRESRSFLSQLSTWITSQYLALLDKGHKEKNAWEVISRTVRVVFKELARARSVGRGFPTVGAGRGEAQVWACLQGLRVQRDFLAAKFSAHRAVICILHDYLMDTSITKTAHEEALAAQEARLMSVINNKMAGINRGNRNG